MKIFVWGAGFAARELLENELAGTKIYAFIDSNLKQVDGYPTYSPEDAVNENYDAVVVATGYAREVYEQAQKLKFDISKFVFVYNNYIYSDMNSRYDLAEKIFPLAYVDVIKNRYHVIRGMMQDEIKESLTPLIHGGGYNSSGIERNAGMYLEDYNRIRTFELAVDEIISENVDGSVAELGVFRGEFARYINAAFKDRTCYLFDTFEGFRESEAVKEKESGNCTDAFIQRFKDASVQKVLQTMPFPDTVVCKKGLFPESLEGLEDTFAFVSIDVDFEESIYEGLSYFYPRLNAGGYIFVHDYNSSTLQGVRNAVRQYEKDHNINLAKVPVPDLNGTLVITK